MLTPSNNNHTGLAMIKQTGLNRSLVSARLYQYNIIDNLEFSIFSESKLVTYFANTDFQKDQ